MNLVSCRGASITRAPRSCNRRSRAREGEAKARWLSCGRRRGERGRVWFSARRQGGTGAALVSRKDAKVPWGKWGRGYPQGLHGDGLCPPQRCVSGGDLRATSSPDAALRLCVRLDCLGDGLCASEQAQLNLAAVRLGWRIHSEIRT